MTLEMAVAPIALAMANHPHLEDYDLSLLRYVMWGATPVTESVARTVTERTGVGWLPAYGASELPVLAATRSTDPEAWRLDSAGLPAAGVELRVVDLDDRRGLPAGEIGEIQARSPSAMAGYLPDEANADAFVDGWYRTGDIGWLEPEGWVHLTDRSKEMIKVKGFQVAPAEIEAVLHGHPSVLDCAVFGVPDERGGRGPRRRRAARPRPPVSAEELQALVADTLATYKQLRDVVVVDEIPRLPSGKVLRRVLRDQWSPNPAVGADGRPPLPRAAGAARHRRAAGRPPRRRRRSPRSTTPSVRRSSRPPWPARAGGSCGLAEEEGAPLASAVEVAIVAEELGRRPGRHALPRPDPRGRAPPAGWRTPGARPRRSC